MGALKLRLKNSFKPITEAYLELSQKSTMKHFCENSYQVLAVKYFLKRTPS